MSGKWTDARYLGQVVLVRRIEWQDTYYMGAAGQGLGKTRNKCNGKDMRT